MDSCIVWSCQEPRMGRGGWAMIWPYCEFHSYVNPYPFDGKLVRKLEAL